MKYSIRIAISILASAASFAAVISTPVLATPMQVVKPTPDLDKYCQRHYGVNARLMEFSATGWQCYKNSSQKWGISVSRACKEQFGYPKAAYSNKADPYSWRCTTTKPKPDLNRYCKKHFGNAAKAKLVGGTALDWVCAQGTDSRWGISGNKACREQHDLPRASFTKRNDPYSWYCHR